MIISFEFTVTNSEESVWSEENNELANKLDDTQDAELVIEKSNREENCCN